MGHVVYEKERENKSLLVKIISIVVSVVALGFLVGGTCFYLHVSNMEKEYKSVVAKIENIEKYRERHAGGKTHTHYNVTVSYQVNGSTYTEKLNEYSSSMEIGGTITLMYNPADPSEVHSTEIGGFIAIVFMATGALVLLIYWLGFRKLIKKVLLREKQEG